jgi:hypothetical protein
MSLVSIGTVVKIDLPVARSRSARGLGFGVVAACEIDGVDVQAADRTRSDLPDGDVSRQPPERVIQDANRVQAFDPPNAISREPVKTRTRGSSSVG